jgi:hypothetical protein
MTDSIRQQIIDAIDTRLRTISLPGTYNSIRQRIIDTFGIRLTGISDGLWADDGATYLVNDAGDYLTQ